MTFNLAGQTYSLSSTAVLGGIAGQTGRLTLTNGRIDGSNLDLGDVAGATGILTVSTNGQWTGTGSFIGEVAPELHCTKNGGVATVTSASLGSAPTGIGTATVTGDDSTWNAGSFLSVGALGKASVAVTAGGLLTSTSTSIGNGVAIALGRSIQKGWERKRHVSNSSCVRTFSRAPKNFSHTNPHPKVVTAALKGEFLKLTKGRRSVCEAAHVGNWRRFGRLTASEATSVAPLE